MVDLKKGVRDRAMRTLSKLPRLSMGASSFLAALAKREVEPDQLVSIVGRDPMLAVRVLELANSSVFGRLHRVESIPRAVTLLGPSTLRRYGLRWTFGGLFRSLPDFPRWSTSQFTSHAETTALLMDILCDHLPVGPRRDGAFVAGLVHDIGKFAVCAEASDAIDFILTLRALGQGSATEVERSVLGIDHAEISAMAADHWQLGEDICQAVFYHHEPSRNPDKSEMNLSNILVKADAFVNGLGLSFLSTSSDASKTLEWPGYEKQIAKSLQAFEDALVTHGVPV